MFKDKMEDGKDKMGSCKCEQPNVGGIIRSGAV